MPRTLLLLLSLNALGAAAPTELALRGHAVIPSPQRVTLRAGSVRLDGGWRVEGPAGMAARSLGADLAAFHGLRLQGGGTGAVVLSVRAGAVTGAPAETAGQAYRLSVAPGRIEITGNGEAGLFYGVQTLVQLLKRGAGGEVAAPECEIEDWPQLALRFLHWDSKHHQDRMPALKRSIDWAARFKANMIGFELEDKFAYPSHPAIGAPGAYTPAEMQEIVNYGLERFVQVVPVIQTPAHMSYVLKHPQYAHLKADGNNYQACLCLEDTYKLIFEMFDDVIKATKGVDYLFVSTDEVYYAGTGGNCKKPYTPENRSAILADFDIRARNHLASRGRRMLAWLEYPLLEKDLERIPADVIDGVMGEDGFEAIEKRRGMRQLAYVSLQGSELLFPDHLAIESLPAGTVMGEFETVYTEGRLGAAYHSIAHGRVMRVNPIGVFGAAWDDSGPHNETFWLGWSAAARWGWHPGVPGPEQHAAEFMQVYFGAGSEGLVEVYRATQRQARAWQRQWDRVVSKARGPGYGNSDGKGIGTARQDLTLEAPPLPHAVTLAFQPRFSVRYRGWLAETPALSLRNDELKHALLAAMLRVERNHYNLEVMLSLAGFIGHHWELFSALAAAERDLGRAARAAAAGKHGEAVGHLVAASNRVGRSEESGATAARQLQMVFEKSRYRNGRNEGGREFVQALDDTKDHWAGRTADLSYLWAPEKSIGLARWRQELERITRGYAARHRVAVQGLAAARLEE